MRLAFCGARANGAPGDQVAQVLRRDRVQRLGAAGQPKFVDGNEQAPGNGQAFFNVERVVHARVVDQPFPAHRGAGLLKVHPHHQEQLVGHLGAQGVQAMRVVHGGVNVVNGARPHHHQQARVAAVQNMGQGLACTANGLRDGRAGGNVFMQLGGRQQRLLRHHVQVFKGAGKTHDSKYS